MKSLLKILAVASIAAAAAVCVFEINSADAASGQSASNPTTYQLPGTLTGGMARACFFQPGAWTNIACTGTGTAAASAALDSWARYVIQCPQNAYFRMGTSTTTATPTTADGYLPAGTWLVFGTTDTLNYVGCLPQATQTGCQILECK